MPLRGEALRRAIRVVVKTFGADAEQLLFVGGCVLGLYARRDAGAPLRPTNDVDCISNVSPWAAQLGRLSKMVEDGTLAPDPRVVCRYAIVNTDVEVDVMSPEGFNVPTTDLFRRAALHAREYDAGEGERVKAVAPAYFLALKLEAFLDRGQDVYAKDMEDIVALVVEVPGLLEEARTEGIDAEIAALWKRAFEKLAIDASYLGDLVDAHGRGEEEHRDRVIDTIRALAKA